MNIEIFEDIILNTVLIVFPILVYLVLVCYKNDINKNYNNLLLSIALISSLYLCLRFGIIDGNSKVLLFCNIPIVIALMKKKPLLGVLLALINILYCFFIYKNICLIVTIKYLTYFILYLCARKRRGALYNKAQELGCNKIALGHHFDDVVETILMSMIFNGEFKTMMPILDSTNFEGMKLIRPLYYVRESDIISFTKYNNLNFINCACDVTRKSSGKRKEMKNLINTLKTYYEKADINIMNSTYNVNLNTIISYIDKEKENDKR